MENLDKLLVNRETSVRSAMALIDENARGIVLVVQEDRRLIDTITDGDIRRAILRGMGLEATVGRLLDQKRSDKYPEPITAREGASRTEILQLMREASVRQVPIVDADDQVVDLVTTDELISDAELETKPHAVIMAGGFGTRLRPLTDDTPKPMLPVGDRPLMEWTIEKLRESGIRHVNVTTHYLAEEIESHFGDGEEFGVNLNYVEEEAPLGTAGALGLLESTDCPLLVINGDILTKVDFGSIRSFHREQEADMTVAVRRYDVEVPYGVVECEGERVARLWEKPTYDFLVNAGIYLLEPTVHEFLSEGERVDMTDLIDRLVEAGRRVVSFPVVEYWIDVGQLEDYKQARADYANHGE